MHKIYCVLGRTASGKSSLTAAVAEILGLKVLKSYTTRPKRNDKDNDHIFIKSEDVENYRNDIIAYTKIGQYEYFATRQLLESCDFYVIDPIGYYDLVENTKDMDIQLDTIYITASLNVIKQHAKLRGDDYQVFSERFANENNEFSNFEKSGLVHYRILNDGTFDDAVQKFIRIMGKEGYK